MKFEHGFLLDHHPSDPGVGDGQQEKEPHDGTGAEVQELDAEGEGKEDASREDVDGPFDAHAFKVAGHDTSYLLATCFQRLKSMNH